MPPNPDLNRLEAFMQKLADRQDLYIRKEDYVRGHDKLLERVENIEREQRSSLEESNKEHQHMREEWQKLFEDLTNQHNARCDRMKADFEAVKGDVANSKVKTLIWIVSMLVSLLTGTAFIQFLHILTGK